MPAIASPPPLRCALSGRGGRSAPGLPSHDTWYRPPWSSVRDFLVPRCPSRNGICDWDRYSARAALLRANRAPGESGFRPIGIRAGGAAALETAAFWEDRDGRSHGIALGGGDRAGANRAGARW